ncbi:hypothetical protein CAXC1_70022 [Candidatus Xenohaliotis californiensis]|uniref:Uncharacterized protein n=1 Tax=Candidatus Xenohaliotis californiensis TaxID=84677 RepID=A0ABP0EU11_9RICK|nr:hypothetical protein CAXC1_70022 [Candidatus Xenohaliotis californiensis]
MMFFNKQHQIKQDIRRFVLRLVMAIFSSMHKTWIVFSKEYLNTLRDDIDAYIETLNMKIYIISILAVENRDFDGVLQKMQNCKKLMMQVKYSCFLYKKDSISVRNIKDKISKIHRDMSINKIKFHTAMQIYKQSISSINDSDYLLYSHAKKLYSPSTGLSFTAVAPELKMNNSTLKARNSKIRS